MTAENTINLASAIQDYWDARQKASLRELMARLTGTSSELLSFEEVRQKLKAQVGARRVIQEIPLDSIVGSVNRYEDFTRDFLPRANVDADRWARVKLTSYSLEGPPPIEVYQIGQVYFVSDGNHRVSVARQLGASHIQAYVTEVNSRVPIAPQDRPDDIILKAEYVDFLDHTLLDTQRPQADIRTTVPGKYAELETHIDVHRYYMGLEQQREIAYSEAAAHWYDTVYTPVVEIIRERGLLRDFPGRTEADLYLWLAEHRAALEEELSRQVTPEQAASDLAAKRSPRPGRVAARLGARMLGKVSPGSLEESSSHLELQDKESPGWQPDHLFGEVLVPLNGQEDGWVALEQALVVARREPARLQGLYIASDEAQAHSPEAQAIQEAFARRCQEAGLEGENRLEIDTGDVARKISEYARSKDLVVVNLTYPPESGAKALLEPGFRTLVQRCPTPILAAPKHARDLQRALLAYDGSPKAQEALFIAAYLGGRWHIPLQIISVVESGRVAPDTLSAARQYMERHGVEATYTLVEGCVAEEILRAADEFDADLLLMGSYGRSPLLQAVLGSAVDEVLRQAQRPLLLCR